MTKPAKISKPEAVDDGGFDDMYGSNWLGPDDIKKPFTTVIDSQERHHFPGLNGGKEKDKLALTLRNVRKPLVCNKTNALTLADAYARIRRLRRVSCSIVRFYVAKYSAALRSHGHVAKAQARPKLNLLGDA
jgi:hypothetical protein